MNINELEQLAKAATPGPWKISGTKHVVSGGNYVVALDCISENAKHIAAANPSAIRELIAAYREAVDALVHIQRCIPINGFAQIHHESPTWEQIDASLDTAKRLGVE